MVNHSQARNGSTPESFNSSKTTPRRRKTILLHMTNKWIVCQNVVHCVNKM